MNILFSSLSGQDQTQSIEYLRVLQRLGHHVFSLPVPTYKDEPRPRFWVEPGYAYEVTLDSLARQAQLEPDILLYIEPRGLIPRGIERASIPTVCILCDTHQWLEARRNLARFFDHVFLYHRNYLRYFDEHPAGHVHWHPYACDLQVFRPMGLERDLDVAFVGQPMPKATRRAPVLRELAKHYKVNEQRYYLREEISGVYARAKIVLNLPIRDDLNFRTFEAMSCGAMLLTRRVSNGQEVLFEEGRQYAAYADESELFEKVDYYLAHPAEREAIAAAGLAEVQQRHRLDQRIEELLKLVKEKPEQVAPVRRMSSRQIDRQYAWLYEYWKTADPLLHLVQEARRAGRPWLPLVPPAFRCVLRLMLRDYE